MGIAFSISKINFSNLADIFLSFSASIRIAARPAFLEPAFPIDIVGTGIPDGICTIDNKLSRPSRVLFIGTPRTGNGVSAAVTNTSGKILAMMPHPERAFYHHHQPDWQNRNHNSQYCDGYKIFHNAKKYIK